MKHRKRGRKFGRPIKIRRALEKTLLGSLIRQGRLVSTLARAKEIRPLAEKLITKAKKGDLSKRRQVSRILGPKETEKLFKDYGSKYKNRKGGYTRIYRSGSRQHDRAEMAVLEFVE
jgi:large subunit ribosomal protein L17